MKKIVLTLFILSLSIFAKDIAPLLKIDAGAMAKDIALKGDSEILIGTDSGELKVYNYKDKNFTKIIKVPKIKDFMGDIIDTRIASVDYLNGKYLLVSDSGIGGYADIRIHENNKTVDIITEKDKLPVVKAKFVDDNHIILGFLSNEVALFDIKNKKLIYKNQLSESKFSDFALNEKKDLVAFSCESGEIFIIDTKSGKVVKKLKGLNLDNVYKVDFKNNYVSCAGQDRRGAWYNTKTAKGDYIEGKFLIYATGLSPDASLVAFPMDEQNNIYIYNKDTKSKLYTLKGQKSTLNTIVFKNNNTLFSASDDNIVIMWKLK